MDRKREIYVHTDVEANGPIPGPFSLWSIGSVAMQADKTIVSYFSANLLDLPGAGRDPQTTEFWARNPEAYVKARRDARDPLEVMEDYADWLKELPGRPVFVGSPVGFDFLFVRWYFIYFLGYCPFGHSALDLRSFAMPILGRPFFHSGKRRMPAHLRVKAPHTHVSVEDALEQGLIWSNLYDHARRLREQAGALVHPPPDVDVPLLLTPELTYNFAPELLQ